MEKADNIIIRINAKLKEDFIRKCKREQTSISKKLRDYIKSETNGETK